MNHLAQSIETLQRAASRATELHRLRDRVEELEHLLGISDAMPRLLPIRPACAIMLSLLMRREFVSREALRIALSTDGADRCESTVKVYAHHLRRYLAPREVTLKTVRARGYYLTADDKARVRAIMGELTP